MPEAEEKLFSGINFIKKKSDIRGRKCEKSENTQGRVYMKLNMKWRS